MNRTSLDCSGEPLVHLPSLANAPLHRIFEGTKFYRKHPVLLENVGVSPEQPSAVLQKIKGFSAETRSFTFSNGGVYE